MLVLVEQFNLPKKHITLLTWPIEQLRLKRTSFLSLKLEVGLYITSASVKLTQTRHSHSK